MLLLGSTIAATSMIEQMGRKEFEMSRWLNSFNGLETILFSELRSKSTDK